MEETNGVPQTQPPSDEELQARSFIENSKIMNSIVREIKEIPELPSEMPKDSHALLRVELPDKGGIHTYMEGYDQPYRGFPFHEFVDKIDTLKKIFRGVLSSVYHSIKGKSKLRLLPIALNPWLINTALMAGINASHRIIDRFKIKPLRYSEPMRELYRVLSIEYHGETTEARQVRKMVRDLVCMVLENDNAYRFRFQDVIVELDKDALEKNAGKEVVRLLRILQRREKTPEVRDTWELMVTFIPWYLFLNPSIRRYFVEVLTELDLKAVLLSVEDRYFCKPRKDYTFGFNENENVSSELLSEHGGNPENAIPEMGRA